MSPPARLAIGRLQRYCGLSLTTIQPIMIRAARLNPRKKRPNTYQLLLALTPPEAAEGNETDFNF